MPLALTSCELLGDNLIPATLTLTSDNVGAFDAQGGEGIITYSLTNASESVKLSVSCEAEWIDITEVSATDIKYSVAVNDGAARSTSIVVAYGELSFDVNILQESRNGSEDGENTPSIELKSQSTMQFTTQGGEGSISYVLKNPIDGVDVKATCSDSWVSKIKVDDDVITFKVAANSGKERTTRIAVKYGNYGGFNVDVKQKGELAYDNYLFDIAFTSAVRGSNVLMELEENQYYIRFKDDNNNSLDILIEGDDNDVLKAGTYSVDNNTLLGAAFFNNDTKYSFADGKAVVSGSYDSDYKFDIVLVDTNNKPHHYTYEGRVQNMKSMVPTQDTEFTAQVFIGEYYGNGNYLFVLSDNGMGKDSDLLPNSTYYFVNIYAESSDTRGSYSIIPSGTYYFDANNTTSSGTFSNEISIYCVSDSYGDIEARNYEDGVVEITSSGITLKVTIDGHEHTVTYNGKPICDDGGTQPDEEYDVVVEAKHAYTTFHGDEQAPGIANNFTIILCDVALDTNSKPQANGSYYYFDIYSPIQGETIVPGTYTIDINDSCQPWSISTSYSPFKSFDSYGNISDGGYFESGKLVIYDDLSMEAICTAYGGTTHKVVYNNTKEEVSDTTLKDNLTCDFDNHNLKAYFMGDILDIGIMYWQIMFEPIGGVGDYASIHLLSNSTSTVDFTGNYTFSNSNKQYTAIPGYVSENKKFCSWYFNSKDGYNVYEYAAIKRGNITINNTGNDTISITLEMYDGNNNLIIASWSGKPQILDQTTNNTQSSIMLGNIGTLKHATYKRGSATLNVPKKSISGKRLKELYEELIW